MNEVMAVPFESIWHRSELAG